MATSMDNKIDSLSQLLLQQTVKMKLEWVISDPPNSITVGSNDIISLYFKTTYRDKSVGVFTSKYQDYSGDFDTFFWNDTVRLVILDKNENVLLESNKAPRALLDLYSILREKASGIDQLISDMLEDSKDSEL